MDFFPSLGEPGILDELFWFGPLGLQFILGLIFFCLLGPRMKGVGMKRFAATVGLVFVADIVLFHVFSVVFKMANPNL